MINLHSEADSFFPNAREWAESDRTDAEPAEEHILAALDHSIKSVEAQRQAIERYMADHTGTKKKSREKAMQAFAEGHNALNALERFFEETKPEDSGTPCISDICDGKARLHAERGKPTGAVSVGLEDPIPIICKKCGTQWLEGKNGKTRQ